LRLWKRFLAYLQMLPGAFGSNNPHPADTLRITLVKILRALFGSGTAVGAPSITGVLDGGLNRVTVTNGNPYADPNIYDWWLEVSSDGVTWNHFGNYAIQTTGTTEIDFGVIFGSYARVRWVVRATEGSTDVTGSPSNEIHIT